MRGRECGSERSGEGWSGGQGSGVDQQSGVVAFARPRTWRGLLQMGLRASPWRKPEDDLVYDVTHILAYVHIPDGDDADNCPDETHWQPAEIAVSPPWYADLDGGVFYHQDMISTHHENLDCDGDSTPETVSAGWDSANISEVAILDQTVDGPYDIRVRKTGDIDCSWLARDSLTMEVHGVVHTSTGDPLDMVENPLESAEDDMACTASASAITGMQLIGYPSWDHPVAIGVSGERQHLYSQLTSVSVSDWKDADSLEIVGQDGATLSLTPATPTASPASGQSFYLSSLQWKPGSSTATGAYQMPTVSVSHSCPAAFGTDRRQLDQAYDIDLATLDGAIDTATGGTGLGDLMTIASATDWPVLVARVNPIGGAPLSTGETHVLRLELQGTRVHHDLLLTETNFGRWDLAESGPGWSLVGNVARNPGTLTLALTGGSFTTPAGTQSLSPVTVVLSVYPSQQ